MADFTITSLGGTFTGKNNNTGQTTTSSIATTVVATVFGWMSTDQSVEFIGDFPWGATVPLDKNIYMDFIQATVTGLDTLPNAILIDITSEVIVNGGKWTGAATNTRLRWIGGAGNSIINGIDATNFKLEFTQYCGPNITVQTCVFHDGTLITYYIASNNQGFNTIKGCTIARTATGVGGIYVGEMSSNNTIEGCTFDDMGYHSIYLSSYDTVGTSIGKHIVRYNTFKNFKNYNQAGVHIKCPSCKIYNNDFRDFTAGYGPCAISLYSDFNYSNANDNEIYNNTFSNMWDAIRIGNALANQPEYRNKIYGNTFTNVASNTGCISLNYAAGAVQYPLVDTWIYCNKFVNCPTPFPFYLVGGSSMIQNTVIARNEFDVAVPANEITALQSYINTMIYDNVGLPDYNVPATKQVTSCQLATQYSLTTGIIGSGVATRTPDQTTYAEGTPVTLTAVADTDYEFDYWSEQGHPNNTSNPYMITMGSDRAITAVFKPVIIVSVDVQITVDVVQGDITENGTSVANQTRTYNVEDVITLVPAPNTGYEFVRWEETKTDNSTQTITMPFTVAIDTSNIRAVFKTTTITSELPWWVALGLLTVSGIYLLRRK